MVSLELTQNKTSVTDSLDYCNDYFSIVGKVLSSSILASVKETHKGLALKTATKLTPSQPMFLDPSSKAIVNSLING